MPCPKGPEGVEGPPGPPTLQALIREWVKEDPILNKHFQFTSYTEGTYIETKCEWAKKANQHRYPRVNTGYSLALLPWEGDEDKRIIIFYHGNGSKVKGYLKREDPLFITKLRDFLILGHDSLYHELLECRIKWEYGDTLSYREEAVRQSIYEDGVDL